MVDIIKIEGSFINDVHDVYIPISSIKYFTGVHSDKKGKYGFTIYLNDNEPIGSWFDSDAEANSWLDFYLSFYNRKSWSER
jgi:hypothetical protein